MLLFVGALPFVVYLVVYPLFVGRVTVTFPFVQPVGLIDALPTAGTPPVIPPLVIDPLVVTFPAASFACTLIVYCVFCVKPVNVYVPLD